jgi:hypothetical protein
MTKRFVRGAACVGIAVCMVALAFGLTLWLLGLTTAVTRTNVERIQPGMSRAEVEAILGGPGLREPWDNWSAFGKFIGEKHIYRWTGAHGVARIEFASSGGRCDLVRSADFEATWRSNRRDPMRSLRAWLGR